MLSNYIKIAFRNILRQKSFSVINIFGFAVGLAVCMIITFYVMDDLFFDSFHEDADSIYRLLTADVSLDNGDLMYGITSGPLVKGLKEEVPEILAATRVTHFGRSPLARGDLEVATVEEEGFNAITLVADPDFFKVFSFPIIAGNMENALEDLDGIYLTKETALAVFGDEDPLGKPLNFLNLENAFVAGIVQQPPTNSSIRFDCVVPLRLEWSPVWWDSWTNVALTGYIRTSPGSDMLAVQTKIVNYAAERGFAKIWQPRLQRLKDIHLNSGHLRFDVMNWFRSDRRDVFTTGVVALLVLLVASINFINLSSARASRRAKEVGMRKIIGGKRSELITQFLGESMIITFLAAILAAVIFEMAIHQINNFLHREPVFSLFSSPLVLLGTAGVILVVGILAGIYPAMIISGFKSMSVLKGDFPTSRKGLIMRRILVVGQFTVAISLISAVLVVKRQIDFMNRVDLGYERENVMEINGIEDDNWDVYKDKLLALPEVESIGSINSYPGGTLQKFQVVPEGFTTEQGAMFDRLEIDAGLISTLRINLLQGRDFSPVLDGNNQANVILNETAVRMAGWEEDPVGKTVTVHREDSSERVMTIIGVVKDFNYTTTRRSVNPMFLVYSPDFNSFLVRFREINEEVLGKVEALYLDLGQERPFAFHYFDEIFNFQFQGDRRFASLITVFSIIAIVISCLGLLGLSSYITTQRTKEIGIRKVLGSTIPQIVRLLSVSFTRWVLLANLIAWPVTWYVMNLWLSEFAYRMKIPLWLFPVSGIAVMIIALLTISVQTIRAASSNPVKALQYE